MSNPVYSERSGLAKTGSPDTISGVLNLTLGRLRDMEREFDMLSERLFGPQPCPPSEAKQPNAPCIEQTVQWIDAATAAMSEKIAILSKRLGSI